jgi:broad specificity phosphatase PhoE
MQFAAQTVNDHSTTHFIFVRHGQTDWNRENRYRGRADIPLNATGIEQAVRAASALAGVPFTAIYASPLRRTTLTAELIANSHGLPVTPCESLIDLNYGDWQGRLPSDLDPAQQALWRTQPDGVVIPNGESLDQARTRVMTLIDDLSRQHRGATVLLVSHDLIGKVLVCGLIDAPNNAIHRVQQDTTCINVFDATADGYLIRAVNDTTHLA